MLDPVLGNVNIDRVTASQVTHVDRHVENQTLSLCLKSCQSPVCVLMLNGISITYVILIEYTNTVELLW